MIQKRMKILKYVAIFIVILCIICAVMLIIVSHHPYKFVKSFVILVCPILICRYITILLEYQAIYVYERVIMQQSQVVKSRNL